MAVIAYDYNDRTQLSPHFNVQEFKCKCGKNHTILISEELIEKLEQLFQKLNCSKIIITSGYRDNTYDLQVGGTSNGYHAKGMATDIKCYDINNNIISSKLVCCAAQDIGFGGITNINSSYTSTHVDVRTSNFWKGNEVFSYSTITSDFYSYYGIQKQEQVQQTKKDDYTSWKPLLNGIEFKKEDNFIYFKIPIK